MSDHAVLIPTSEGPVGGIVSEPTAEPRAAAILLPGLGRPARSGINSFWARLARSLADEGIVVLRYDGAREGETLPIGEDVSGQVPRRQLDRTLLGQVAPWFHERAEAGPLLLAGACSGAFLAAEQAGIRPDLVAASFLVVPYLRPPVEPGDPVDPEAVDPEVLRGIRALLDDDSAWILIGENDYHREQIPPLVRLLGPAAPRLEVEVVPEMALHMLDQPDIQEQVRARLTARIEAAVAAAQPAGV